MRPYVTLNCAMSLDGFIGKPKERIRFSNEADKRRVHRMRAESDGIIVGINTVLTDDPHLTVRHGRGRNPVRIVIDSRARTPLDSNVLDGNAPTIIAVSRKANEGRRIMLQGRACVITAGRDEVDLRALMQKLYETGLRKIMLEGGGTLNRSMLAGSLVDELYLTVTPVILGSGIRWINGALPKRIALSYTGCRRMGGQLVMHYKTK